MKSNKAKKDRKKINACEIKSALDSAQRAQRNYDLTKQISQEDLDTLIYAAKNSPSKQNETHYALHVFTDRQMIEQIYNQTKNFLLFTETEKRNSFGEENGKFWQNTSNCVHNSQTLANCLFVYCEDMGNLRCGEHIQADIEGNNNESKPARDEQVNYSIGISVGELILSSALLGYKTGICSAFNKHKVAEILETTKTPKILVGIGFDNINVSRLYHAQTYNSELPEKHRTGRSDEKWKFPSFEKQTQVKLNKVKYSN